MSESDLRLAESLLRMGLLRPEEVEASLAAQPGGTGLGETLVRQGTLSAGQIQDARAHAPRESAEPFAAAVRRLERYVLIGELGRGGMGTVYLAFDAKLKRRVALKAMRTVDSEDESRFRREVEIAALLQHPNIASVYDAHEIQGIHVIAMQYVEGKTLEGDRLAAREALDVVAHAARAVQYAHENGIIHRDLKPANLMRANDGRVFVLDFGIARPIEKLSGLTRTGTLVGTPAYMSPEQASAGALDARTDVYSLGATLYALATGRHPFGGENVLEVLKKVEAGDLVPPRKLEPRIHADVETIVLKAMRREAGARYGSARELAEDAERFLAGEPIRAKPMSAPTRVARFLRRRPWAMATALAFVVGLIASGYLLLRASAFERATRLLGDAVTEIELWDKQLLYPPTRDLAPYEEHLRKAVRLCDEALKLARLAPAHYQKARALARLGRSEEAERALGEAIRTRPTAEYHLERARLRLNLLTRSTIDPSRTLPLVLVRFPLDLHGERRGALPRSAVELREGRNPEILKDLEAARLLGSNAGMERGWIEVLDSVHRREFAGAAETCGRLLSSAGDEERVRLHKTLALVHFLEHVTRVPGTPVGEYAFIPSPALLKSREELSRAIELRRSDPELLILKVQLEASAAAEPVLSLLRAQLALGPEDQPPGTSSPRAIAHRQALGKEAARLREHQRAAAGAARSALETAQRIRPDDAQALLLIPTVRLISLFWVDYFLLMMGVPVDLATREMETLGREVGAGFREGVAACRKVLETDPKNASAWVQLSFLQFLRVDSGFMTFDWDRDSAEALETFQRTLGLELEPVLEAPVRFYRISLRWGLYVKGGKKDEQEVRLALQDLERLRTISPEFASLSARRHAWPEPRK